MITKREKKLSQLMIAAQVTLTLLLFVILSSCVFSWDFTYTKSLFIIVQIAVVWCLLFSKFRLGIIFRTNTFGSMLRGYLVTICFGSVLLYIELELFSHFEYIPKTLEFVLAFSILNLLSLIVFKLLFYYFMRRVRRKGYNSRHAIIIADNQAIPFIDSFINAKDWGYRLKAILTPTSSLVDKYDSVQLIETSEELKEYITLHTIDDIFYCIPIDDRRYNLDKLILEIEEIGISLHILQNNYLDDMNVRSNMSKDSETIFVTHQTVPLNYFSLKLKDLLDLLFSLVVVFFLIPVFGLIALLIKLEDGGPIIFKQERIGLNGRRFICFKFRSMVVNAEDQIANLQSRNESDGPTFKIENDPRITRIGKILRKTSLDELPQFINVIKGEMSVVGPRPPLLVEVQQYQRTQLRRLSMKPGITCIWQVYGRNEVSFEEWMRMDLHYIDHWSLLTDIKIIIATVSVVLKANGR